MALCEHWRDEIGESRLADVPCPWCHIRQLERVLERIIAKEKAGHSRKELAGIAREALGIKGEPVSEAGAG